MSLVPGVDSPLARPARGLLCGVDLMDAIYERRAVRAYEHRTLEKTEILALIDAAIQAPSAMNRQPWAFVVLQDASLLKRISARAKQLTLAHMQPGTALFEHRGMLEDPAVDVFHGAGTLIVICAASGPWPPNEDCCLAAQNLMLAAHGFGLGTCPIGFAREALNEPEMKRELGIPDDHSVVMPIIVGHPIEHPLPTPRHEARVLAWK
jgi:nitroreductase